MLRKEREKRGKEIAGGEELRLGFCTGAEKKEGEEEGGRWGGVSARGSTAERREAGRGRVKGGEGGSGGRESRAGGDVVSVQRKRKEARGEEGDDVGREELGWGPPGSERGRKKGGVGLVRE